MKPTRAVPLLLSVFLSFFFALANGSATEIFVGEPAYGLAPGQKNESSVASDGRDFLAVWQDDRGGSASILASRISQSGAVLDPLGILIAAAPDVASPRVIWAGDAYIVVWWDFDRLTSVSHLMAARIDRDGRVVTQPRSIADNVATGGGHYVATNGSRIVVLCRPTGGPSGQYGAVHALVLDTSLHLLSETPISGVDADLWKFSVASNGSTFLAVWSVTAAGTIEGMRLDANGNAVDAAPRVIGAGSDPDVASDGSRFLVVVRVESDSGATQAARVVDADLHSSELRPLPGSSEAPSRSVFWTGTSYVVVAQKYSGDIVATRVTPDGIASNAETIVPAPASGSSYGAAAATNGTRMLIVRSADPYPKISIHARLYDTATFTPVSEERRVTTSANEQTRVAVAFDGTNHFVVWMETGGVYGTRVSPGGESLDGRGVLLGSKAAVPHVVFDGANYIVAWVENDTEIVVRFVGTDGVAGTELRLPVQPVMELDLASGGATSMLVWSTSNYEIHAARIERATQTISQPVLISPPMELASSPTVSSNGIEYLVAWNELEIGDIIIDPVIPSAVRIHGTRLLPSLSVRDHAPLLLADTEDDWDSSPVLASNGTDWMLLWNNSSGLEARRVVTNGTPGAVRRIAPIYAFAPDMKWDGARYVIAYRTWDLDSPVFRTSITPAGVVATPVRIASTESTDRTVSLARGNDGVVFAYARWSWRSEHGGVNRAVLNVPFRKTRVVR